MSILLLFQHLNVHVTFDIERTNQSVIQTMDVKRRLSNFLSLSLSFSFSQTQQSIVVVKILT